MNQLQDADLDEGLALLIKRIRQLRRRLISYGYSICEVNEIILDGFLNVPCQVDWLELGNTSLLYKLKDSLDLEASQSELVMCLVKFFNNREPDHIPEFFLEVIHNNSLAFGIDLNNSSSDSNESEGSRLRINQSHREARRKRNFIEEPRKAVQKRQRECPQSEEPARKKVHIESPPKSLKRERQYRQTLEDEKPQKKQKKS